MMDYGTGLSRILEATDRQLDVVVWQQDMPPLDSEHVLQNHLSNEKTREHVQSMMHSGFLLNPSMATEDYTFDSMWSNEFILGNPRSGELRPVIWANINGWILPIAGTQAVTGVANIVRLNPPPASGNRIDLVFLEVWKALVSANPSTTNKPSASKLWKFGNVEYGPVDLPDDDLTDPAIGFETTKRVQLQYRIRVHGAGAGGGAGVALDVYPDGLGDVNILGQGTASAPVGAFSFTNMRETLGDPSLWRAGDGVAANGLGTVDGYVYAIPLCAVFRRNTIPFVAISDSGDPNQNGAFDRNPSAALLVDPRDGAKVLVSATLNAALGTSTGVVAVNSFVGSGLDDTLIQGICPDLYLWLENELVRISAITVGPNTLTISERGCWGTQATVHAAGASFGFFNTRPDGLFADQVTGTDVLDLRRAVNPGAWDYQHILEHNLGKLLAGQLQSTWKISGPGETEGPYVVETDWLCADSTSLPNHTEPLDGPDGIRTIWSDAAVCQSGVTVMCDPDVPLINGYSTALDITSGWDVGADFQAQGFINNLGVNGKWTNGSSIFFWIGGVDGNSGARATFRASGTRAVRFVMPNEADVGDLPFLLNDWSKGNTTPITARFSNSYAMEPAADSEVFVPDETWDLFPLRTSGHPGPMYPYMGANFERPFIALGGLLDPSFKVGIGRGDLSGTTGGANGLNIELGINFDTFSITLLGGRYTLDDLLNPGGRDSTGGFSILYAVVYGDHGAVINNGAFKVVGAGLTHTGSPASAATRIRVVPLGRGFTNWDNTPGVYNLTVELRSIYSTVEDGGNILGPASMVITLTDVEDTIAVPGDGEQHPWQYERLVELAPGTRDYSLTDAVRSSKLVINTTLLYSPGRGGTARIADDMWRFGLKEAGNGYLRQAKGVLDPTFAVNTGMPADETHYDSDHLQLWNRLSSKGLPASAFFTGISGGGEVISGSEQSREHELFVDRGSKTLLFQPFQSRGMALAGIITSPTAPQTLLGTATYPVSGITKDGLGLYTPAKTVGFAVPLEFMPRFGRQDISYHTDLNSGAGTFLSGINHLFRDSTDPTQTVFNVIGGDDNISGGNAVLQLHFQTGGLLTYGQAGPVAGDPLNSPCYQARRSDTVTGVAGSLAESVARQFQQVRSSDLGAGLVGIQLPPYLGIARLYGVYERDEWLNTGGGKDFDTDRITPTVGAATNLLRTDADQQTLFIMEDGARDVTGIDPLNPEEGDHTYVIPSNAIDVTIAANYLPGDSFTDFDYIVVASVFGFAKGFISENNYVLCRLHNGQGVNLTSYETGDPGEATAELEDIQMVIPAPATLNQKAYVGYSRIPYQGDPYGTRDGNVRQLTDYAIKAAPGQIPPTDSHNLLWQVQQFDPVSGADVLDLPNPRALTILASLDFYTTYGTGKVGGTLFGSTPTDVGYLTPSSSTFLRLEPDPSEPIPDTKIRAFTETFLRTKGGASVFFSILDNTALALAGATNAVVFSLYWGSTLLAQHEVVAGDVDSTIMGTLQNIILALDTSSYTSVIIFRNTGNYVKASTNPGGIWGNELILDVVRKDGTSAIGAIQVWSDDQEDTHYETTTQFSTGYDTPINAGTGTSPIGLTGMTERLPLGILLQDSDFLGESPLNDLSSGMQTFYNGIDAPQTLLPLASDGNEYTRFTATPGETLGMVDGAILQYSPYDSVDRPGGTKKFRLSRGGGAVFMASGAKPGGPVEWVNTEFQHSQSPVLKGGVLAGKALLVRNYPETAFGGLVSDGDEIQMVILTSGVMSGADLYQNSGDLENTTPGNISLSGIISPSGWGFGKTAADRYRLDGKPMVCIGARVVPDPSLVSIAPATTLADVYSDLEGL